MSRFCDAEGMGRGFCVSKKEVTRRGSDDPEKAGNIMSCLACHTIYMSDGPTQSKSGHCREVVVEK